MPKDITRTEPLEHFNMGLYDSGVPDVNLTIMAERIVDITDICEMTQSNLGQTIIKYGRARRGIIAQLQDRYNPGEDIGMSIHFFPEEQGIAGLATDEGLLLRSRMLGCNSLTLTETIFECIPATLPGVAAETTKAPEIRTAIECDEARNEWFIMARTMYVENNPRPRYPIDFEIGIHLSSCARPECQSLADAYENILRPSHPDATELLADVLDQLEATLPPTAR